MKHALRLLSVMAFFACMCWSVGLLWFVHLIPDHVDDGSSLTDGIVALTGGSNRLATAVTLLKEGKAQKLLITGVGEGTTLQALGLLENIPAEDISNYEEKITLGYIAKDTRQNAEETAIWTSLEGVRSIRIVTANYHIPRSMLEFTYTMPKVALIPHPVFPAHVKVKEWWLFPGSTRLILSEYHKYVGSYIQHCIVRYIGSIGHWLQR